MDGRPMYRHGLPTSYTVPRAGRVDGSTSCSMGTSSPERPTHPCVPTTRPLLSRSAKVRKMSGTARGDPGGGGDVRDINPRARGVYSHTGEVLRAMVKNHIQGDSEVRGRWGGFGEEIAQGTVPATCTESWRGPFRYFLKFRTKSGPAGGVTLVHQPPYAEMCAHRVRRIYKRGKQKCGRNGFEKD